MRGEGKGRRERLVWLCPDVIPVDLVARADVLRHDTRDNGL